MPILVWAVGGAAALFAAHKAAKEAEGHAIKIGLIAAAAYLVWINRGKLIAAAK